MTDGQTHPTYESLREQDRHAFETLAEVVEAKRATDFRVYGWTRVEGRWTLVGQSGSVQPEGQPAELSIEQVAAKLNELQAKVDWIGVQLRAAKELAEARR